MMNNRQLAEAFTMIADLSEIKGRISIKRSLIAKPPIVLMSWDVKLLIIGKRESWKRFPVWEKPSPKKLTSY